MRNFTICFFIILFIASCSVFSQTKADSGYTFLNNGQVSKAISYFEDYVKQNPNDTKIRLQLGYLYYDRKQYSRAIKNFEYVGNHSTDSKDIENSKSAVFVIKDELANTSKTYLDIYFHNFYDSFQKNYIGNLITHYNFRIAPRFYTGLYIDAYTDSRSTASEIYNDRFVELGGFLRYNLLRNLFLNSEPVMSDS
jgi:tetratricopeptide (TPR) repeat protein